MVGRVVRGVFSMQTGLSASGGRGSRPLMTRPLAILAALLLGLSLTACSKCDVPTWHPNSPTAPQSCHDGPTQ
jgi:hypothetical protein